MSKSKKGRNFGKKMHFELSPLIEWIALWTVKTYFKFQVNIFSYNRYYKTSKFLHDDDADNNDDAEAVAVPRVFSENSRAKNPENKTKNVHENGWWIQTLILDPQVQTGDIQTIKAVKLRYA